MLVFLGNTGSRYARTRHNAGWLLEEHLTGSAGRATAKSGGSMPGPGWQQKFKGLWARTDIEGSPVVLLEPHPMMNLSGESVQAAARFFKYAASEVAVAHDDVELSFGEIGVRFGGGLGGHNGLRSVAHCLGTRDFWRVRIGIGRPRHGELHGHVLGRFDREEESELPAILSACAELVRRGYRDGFGSLPGKVATREIT